jgi:ribonuclease R
LPAEGLIHVTALADDFYQYDRRTHTLAGRRSGNQFRLGDRARVVVARVDVDRRELDFRLVERRGREAAAAQAGGAKPHASSAPPTADRASGPSKRSGDGRPSKKRGSTPREAHAPGAAQPAKRAKKRRD